MRQKLAEDPTNGQLFVLINRCRTQLKVLYFGSGGYCVWGKRLEAGRFHFNAQGKDKQALSCTDLKWIMEGIDLASVRRCGLIVRMQVTDYTAKNKAFKEADSAAVIRSLQPALETSQAEIAALSYSFSYTRRP